MPKILRRHGLRDFKVRELETFEIQPMDFPEAAYKEIN